MDIQKALPFLSHTNRKKALAMIGFLLGLSLVLSMTPRSEGATLPTGFGKTSWGMTMEDIIASYQIAMLPPTSTDAAGIWAVEGPAPGELTVSGEALGEVEVRSVSFGVHPEWGLAIAHVRFKDTNNPSHVERLLPKWTAKFGPPKERRPGPKIIWEDAETHIELTYHTVSLRHPTPSDHLAIVYWSIPLMEKITSSEEAPPRPDVEKLEPMKELHKDD